MESVFRLGLFASPTIGAQKATEQYADNHMTIAVHQPYMPELNSLGMLQGSFDILYHFGGSALRILPYQTDTILFSGVLQRIGEVIQKKLSSAPPS